MAALKFRGKPVDAKLTNAIDFKLRSERLFKGSLLITDGANIVKFCRAWSILLGVPFNLPAPDFTKCRTEAARLAEMERIDDETQKAAAAFIEGFSNLDDVNPYALALIQRDTPAEQPGKKKRVKR